MKILLILCFIFTTNLSFAELTVRTAIKSSTSPIISRVTSSSFGEVSNTNLNYYPVVQGSSVQWMNSGLEITATNSVGQPVNAEFRISSGSFTLYRNGVRVLNTNMNIFLPPNGGGNPSISVYDKTNIRLISKDYQSIVGTVTGSRIIVSDHMFSIGNGISLYRPLDNQLGSSYVLGYTLIGEYKTEGPTVFTPFTILPGDHGFPAVQNQYRNYVAIVVGGESRESWITKTTQFIEKSLNQSRYIFTSPIGSFPGGHHVTEGETSTDLLNWTPLSLGNINPNTWGSAFFTDSRRFFRAKIGTYSLFNEG